MTDILLSVSPDGGDITLKNGEPTMTDTLTSAAILSLIGGNEDDPGLSDKSRSWWGNSGEKADFQYRSRTQHLLATLPKTSGNLARIEEAALEDLAWLSRYGVTCAAAASLPIPSRVDLQISLTANGKTSTFSFSG